MSPTGTIYRLFTLTFEGQIKGWCDTLLAASIHTWEKFMHYFLHAVEINNYEEVCDEILKLRKKRDESINQFP
jgi:hypothetical protein